MPKLYVLLVWSRFHIMLSWLLGAWLRFGGISGDQWRCAASARMNVGTLAKLLANRN
jgi:hypothetical protein